MKSFNQVRCVIGLFASLVVMAWMSVGASGASTAINVDFDTHGTTPTNFPNTPAGHYTGPGADVADAGTFWNSADIGLGVGDSHASFTSGTLTESDGVTATGASFSLGNYFAQNQQGAYSTTTGYTPTFAPDLFDDEIYSTNTPGGTFSISGLDAGAPYDLYLYSMGGYPSANDTTFTVGGVTGSTTITGLPATYGSAFSAVTAGTSGGGNYVLYSHVIATGGAISGTFTGTNIRFNGFQLVEAPEPASLGLIAVGGLMLLRRRRA